MTTRIILDTDPGIDDSLALASPEVQIEGVCTVSGNVGIEYTTRNALALLELAANGHPVTRLMQQVVAYYCEVFGAEQSLDAIQMHDPLCLLGLSARPGYLATSLCRGRTEWATYLWRNRRLFPAATSTVYSYTQRTGVG